MIAASRQKMSLFSSLSKLKPHWIKRNGSWYGAQFLHVVDSHSRPEIDYSPESRVLRVLLSKIRLSEMGLYSLLLFSEGSEKGLISQELS